MMSFPPETVIWLQERTPLGILSSAVLDAIAQVMESTFLPAESTLVSEGTSPEALYILQQGQLESKTSNKNNPALACGFLPGAIVQLKELLLDEQVLS